VVGTQIVFILNLGVERSPILIVIDIFCPKITHLGWIVTVSKKDNVVLKGPPRRLSCPEITDMLDNLVLDENGNQFVGYEKKHN
jgi:hypothetical protein